MPERHRHSGRAMPPALRFRRNSPIAMMAKSNRSSDIARVISLELRQASHSSSTTMRADCSGWITTGSKRMLNFNRTEFRTLTATSRGNISRHTTGRDESGRVLVKGTYFYNGTVAFGGTTPGAELLEERLQYEYGPGGSTRSRTSTRTQFKP